MKMMKHLIFTVLGMLGLAGSAMASTTTLTTTGSLYSGLVTNVLNGEIGTVVAIGLVALGIFFAFRSFVMTVLSLAAAIVFWNAESILSGVLGMII